MFQRIIITTTLYLRCASSPAQVSTTQVTCSTETMEDRQVTHPVNLISSMPWDRESAQKSSVIRIWCQLMPLLRTSLTTISITTYNSSHPLSFSYCSHRFKNLQVGRVWQVEKPWAPSPMSLNRTNSSFNSNNRTSNRCSFLSKTILKDSSSRMIWLNIKMSPSHMICPTIKEWSNRATCRTSRLARKSCRLLAILRLPCSLWRKWISTPTRINKQQLKLCHKWLDRLSAHVIHPSKHRSLLLLSLT